MAGYSLALIQTVQVAGKEFAQSITVTADNHLGPDVTRPVAKVGQLTTRTDANTGVLTMLAGHAIITGNRLDVYWDGGSRRGMSATVATNAVTVDGGAGTDLPDNLTAVTAQVPDSETMTFSGSAAVALAIYGQRNCIFVFADVSDAELYAVTLSSGGAPFWYSASGLTNPLSGAAVVKVYMSSGDSANTSDMRASVLYN